jgi:hypothetical protein
MRRCLLLFGSLGNVVYAVHYAGNQCVQPLHAGSLLLDRVPD